MKRYNLTILFCVLFATSVSAQFTNPAATQTEINQPFGNTYMSTLTIDNNMRSTSSMVGSGSRYTPTVTAVGATKGNENAPTIRRSPGGHHDEVHDDPIGDAAWPLALLACVYAIYRVRRRIRGR